MGTAPRQDKTIMYITCSGCELNGPGKKPFFRVRLDAQESGELAKYLENCEGEQGRNWYAITATYDEPTKLKLIKGMTPAYEANAIPDYLRGEVLRVSGKNRSCNIEFSGQVGAPLLLERLQTVRKRMRRFLEIRVPNRSNKRNLIEFISDTDLEAIETLEHQRLVQAGGVLASEIFPEDDFSDWESHDG